MPELTDAQLAEIEAPAFQFKETTATHKVFAMNTRIRAVAGGTSASKTVSIMFWIIKYCQTQRNKLVHVVSESYPHLEAGSMLDFQNIMQNHGYWNRARWNETKHQYEFETGTKLRFYSLDVESAHGPRRDVLFLNEANNIPMAVYDQLEPRTRETIWLDWNPSTEFWFYTQLLDNPELKEDLQFITLTYKDNEALDRATVKSIESRKGNKNWWRVYGLGQLGEVEGRIYTGWQSIDEIPHEARLMRYGLDFGYSNDPAAIVAIYYYNGGYIFDEVLYAKGISNQRLAEVLRDQEVNAQVIADSAEPKSIDEIRGYGIPITPTVKGRDSINYGIQFVQDQRISVTKRSLHIWKEYRSYMWEKNDKAITTENPEGITTKAQDFDNHAMDALRYGMNSIRVPVRRPRQKRRQVNLAI